MARLATFVRPLDDPDLGELREVASDHRVSVRINTAAQMLGKPAIELRALHRYGKPMLAVFRHAAEALEWLQAGRQEASHGQH